MRVDLETQFEPGDIVTFRAMQTLEETNGLPQAFSVVSLRLFIGPGVQEILYYCRPLSSVASSWSSMGSKQLKQSILHREATITGLLLFTEEELVDYEPPKPEESETE